YESILKHAEVQRKSNGSRNRIIRGSHCLACHPEKIKNTGQSCPKLDTGAFNSPTIPRKGSESSTSSKGVSRAGAIHAWTKSLTRHSSKSSQGGHKRASSTASSASCELGEEAAQALAAPAPGSSSPTVTCSQPTPVPKKNAESPALPPIKGSVPTPDDRPCSVLDKIDGLEF
ncbi:unnamed protein product, partial [Phyllotreta striolata]